MFVCILVAFDFQFVSRASRTEQQNISFLSYLSYQVMSAYIFCLFLIDCISFVCVDVFFSFSYLCEIKLLLEFPHCRLIVGVVTCCFNPYLPSGLFHPYQLDESISIFRGGWCIFFFISTLFFIQIPTSKQ